MGLVSDWVTFVLRSCVWGGKGGFVSGRGTSGLKNLVFEGERNVLLNFDVTFWVTTSCVREGRERKASGWLSYFTTILYPLSLPLPKPPPPPPLAPPPQPQCMEMVKPQTIHPITNSITLFAYLVTGEKKGYRWEGGRRRQKKW